MKKQKEIRKLKEIFRKVLKLRGDIFDDEDLDNLLFSLNFKYKQEVVIL